AYTYYDPDPQIVEALVFLVDHYGVRFGFTNIYVWQHFLSQIGVESGGLNVLQENLNYSAQRLLEVFPSYFSRNDPSKKNPDNYAHKPKKIANLVYANKIGNGNVASGDGYRFRGRGIIQLTGRANYRAFTNFYDDFFSNTLNFVHNPDLVASNLRVAVMT